MNLMQTHAIRIEARNRRGDLFNVGGGALDDELVHDVSVESYFTLDSQAGLIQLPAECLEKRGLAAARRSQQQSEASLSTHTRDSCMRGAKDVSAECDVITPSPRDKECG